jgi:GNAT superfamily N-acetyltransferase
MTETRIEALTPETLNGARIQANHFMASRKAACGVIPCCLCPAGETEFGSPYRKNPDNYSTSAVAVRNKDGRVVGFVQMSLHGQKGRDCCASLMHTLRPGEAYIEQMMVDAETRGQGIGTRLLEWCEETARAKGATLLSLGVVTGNPAERLYKRFGFEDHVPKDGCCDSCMTYTRIFCILGCPHRRFGGKVMHKPLTETMER